MMLNVAVLPASAISLEITGNGVESENDVEVKVEQKTEVSQNNDFNVNNHVNTNANTGGNSASKNSNGDVSVDTGDASVSVVVANEGNTNEAVADCCSSLDDVEVLISENGDSTDNKVELTNKNKVQVSQNNSSNIRNDVNSDATSGKNDANRNTGGSVSVSTGNALAVTGIFNGGNVNSAVVAGNRQSGGVSARILGNGVHSDNDIDLDLEHRVELAQVNSANIDNDVDTDAVSGKNDASRNTGDNVVIDTGNSEAAVLVDNTVNFNFADVDCGCLFDVSAKIAGNGDSSDNKIRADLEDRLEVGQDNSCDEGYFPRLLSTKILGKYFGGHGDECLENEVYADAYSGFNHADRNTGGSDTDPSVVTGNALTEVVVENAGNSNIFGDVSDWQMPEGGNHSNVSVNISFDIMDLLEMLGLLS